MNDDEFINRTIPYSAMEHAPESISDATFFDSKQTIQNAHCIQSETGVNLKHLKTIKREETNLHKIQNDTKNNVNREFNPNSDDLPYYIYYINPSFLHLTSQENMNQPEDCNTIQSIINIMAIEQVENSTNPMVASNQSTFRATVEQTFNDDKLCEFMESLEELGMVCLNMRNLSNQNPKFKLIPNFEEISKRCRHFLSKQSSDMQCIMLIPRSSSVNSFFISPDSEKQEEKDTPNKDKLKSKQHFTEIEDSEKFKKEYGIVKTPHAH
ncbi:hypothetical protein CEXT_702021 [Caerostris extrusa]|uniref:Uncharacterized protein n=1 Tax=Caerostris extrusa TaxID=172846 RepID=A0AAV4RQE2_CAEEX|nr:hypothetical protein CEXT_702021 [Caerostris extrusa]